MNKKKILIIDDDKFILKVFSRILEKEGYSIETVETGNEALKKLKNNTYDMSLIDVKLPDIDGIDLLSRMHKTNPEITKIVITGFPRLEDANRAMDQGATAYLVKPVRTEELVELIKEKFKKQKDLKNEKNQNKNLS